MPKGINRVDGDLSPTKSGDGTGSVNSDIAILDTGIDINHPDLNVYKQVTFVSGTSSGNDDNGHGTMVAGVSAAKDDSQGVVGIAPGARLWAVKVLDRNGGGFDSDIIKGIDYVTDHKNEIDSVNLSFGGDGPDDALHTAISNSVAAGVTYAVAAGNEAMDAKSFVPASFPEVIAVSAIADSDGKCGSQGPSTSYGSDDTLASFSNYGSVIDLTAPGVDIQTTYKGSSYRSFSGTSASTPFVTGAAALYKSTHPGATPADIRDALRSSGSNPSSACDGKGHGYFKGDRDSTHEPLLYLGSSTSSDTTLPIVTSTSPGGGTSNFQVSSVIKATFSEPMLASSISTNTFTLRIADTTTKIGGAVSLSSDGKTATFDPSANLATLTKYVATISTGATDLAGNALSEIKKWSFTTGGVAQSDTTKPNVIGTSPGGGTSNFQVSSVIKATFSEPMLASSISTNTFTLRIADTTTKIGGAVSLSSDGKTATFDPSANLATLTKYVATISTGATDLAGNALSEIKKWSFTTGGVAQSDTTPSTVASTNPAGGASTHPSVSSSSQPQSHSKDSKNSPVIKNAEKETVPMITTNNPPIAKDDRLRSVANKPVVGKILDNDIDPDGDKLNIISVTSPTKRGSTVTINDNGTVTFLPASNIVGADTFSYIISDSNGKTDNGKVSISIKQVFDRTVDQTNHETTSTKGAGERSGEEGTVQQMQNQADRVYDSRDRIPQQQIQENAPTNANSSNSH